MWYFTPDGKKKVGPISSANLRELAASGVVQRAHMVLKLGTERWVPAFKVHGLFPEGTIVEGSLIVRPNQPAAPPAESSPSRELVPAPRAPAEDSLEEVGAEELPEVLPVGASDTAPCPFCSEQVLASAKKCKHCGEFLDPALRAASRGGPSAVAASTVIVNNANRPAPRRLVVYRNPMRDFLPWHIVHMVLTIVTCGIWSPVWVIHWFIWLSSRKTIGEVYHD
jgi:hypothetical protein